MTIEIAIAHILGDELANEIIMDKGVHWAVVAAMLQATENDSAVALATIRRWKEDQIIPGLDTP